GQHVIISKTYALNLQILILLIELKVFFYKLATVFNSSSSSNQLKKRKHRAVAILAVCLFSFGWHEQIIANQWGQQTVQNDAQCFLKRTTKKAFETESIYHINKVRAFTCAFIESFFFDESHFSPVFFSGKITILFLKLARDYKLALDRNDGKNQGSNQIHGGGGGGGGGGEMGTRIGFDLKVNIIKLLQQSKGSWVESILQLLQAL
ncbi:hypothetical protein ACJX0J_026277, partial [Zea mays]